MVLTVLGMGKRETTGDVVSRLEIIRIRYALRATRGVQKNAARLVRLTCPTLNRKIIRYGIDVSEYQ
ncbi:MAG: helix-turn-helix domain-containing protein [Pseudohongiellaceae bacterium]